MIVKIMKTVLCYGPIPVVRGRVISPSTVTASPVKLTNGVEIFLSRSIDNFIQEKVE